MITRPESQLHAAGMPHCPEWPLSTSLAFSLFGSAARFSSRKLEERTGWKLMFCFPADHPAATGASGGEAEAAGGEGSRSGEGSARRSRYCPASSVRTRVFKERASLPSWGEPLWRHLFWNRAPSLIGFSELLASPRSSASLCLGSADTQACFPAHSSACCCHEERNPRHCHPLLANPGLPLPLPAPSPLPTILSRREYL